MTTLYKFKASFTKGGVGTAPSPAPVATVLDTDANTKLVDAQASTAKSNLPGYYEYEYSGADNLDLVCRFHTDDTTTDQQDLDSYVVDKVYQADAKLDVIDGKADDIYSDMALEATLTAMKGAGWTDETLKAIIDAIEALNDPTPQQVWEHATRELTNPDDYKADVSLLALEATLDAMKGAGWTTETLKAIADAIAALTDVSAADVWAYATRTLTMTATEIVNSVQEGIITQTRGNTWVLDIEDVTLDDNLIQFAIKSVAADEDDDAIILVDTGTGLLVINGATAPDPTKGSLSYAGTTLTVTLAADVTAQLKPAAVRYGIQYVTAAGVVVEPYGGKFTISSDIVRATE